VNPTIDELIPPLPLFIPPLAWLNELNVGFCVLNVEPVLTLDDEPWSSIL